jgi:hypothetical protein
MRTMVNTGQVAGQVETHEAQVTPHVSSRLESRLEWLSNGARTFLSAVALAEVEILEKIGV